MRMFVPELTNNTRENIMQKRNPEQDKWIIQTELPYHRLTLVDPDAANQIAVLLADGNSYGNKYVVRKEAGKWVIPSKDERCIYPTMVYGVKYPMVVYGLRIDELTGNFS